MFPQVSNKENVYHQCNASLNLVAQYYSNYVLLAHIRYCTIEYSFGWYVEWLSCWQNYTLFSYWIKYYHKWLHFVENADAKRLDDSNKNRNTNLQMFITRSAFNNTTPKINILVFVKPKYSFYKFIHRHLHFSDPFILHKEII